MTKLMKKQNGIVVFLDMLGTKGIWKHRRAADILSHWDLFVTTFEGYLQTKFKHLKIKHTFTAFSDTIIITSTGADMEQLLSTTGRSLSVAFPIALKDGVYLRGCLSAGEFYNSNKMTIGPAIDEAAQYYRYPEWIGISAAPSAHRIIEKSLKYKKNMLLAFEFAKYDIPTKNGIERNGWALNWSDKNIYNKKIRSSKTNSHIRKLIYSQLEKAKDVDVAFKWRNTMDFLNYLENTNTLEKNINMKIEK